MVGHVVSQTVVDSISEPKQCGVVGGKMTPENRFVMCDPVAE